MAKKKFSREEKAKAYADKLMPNPQTSFEQLQYNMLYEGYLAGASF